MSTQNLYDNDFYTWCYVQEDLLGQNKFNELDLENLREEIRTLGERHYRTLESRLENLFLHLLKWIYQPEMRGHNWIYSIRSERKEIPLHIEEYPGLKNKYNMACKKAYTKARWKCHLQTGLVYEDLPIGMPFDIEQALDEQWMPE